MGNSCVPRSETEISYSILDNPQELSSTNNLLNRWRCVEVAALKKKYLAHCDANNFLDVEAFVSIFPKLQEVDIDLPSLSLFITSIDQLRLPPDCLNNTFAAFDVNESGLVDFREFCRGLSLCAHGNRMEKLTLLYDLFADVSTGRTASSNSKDEGSKVNVSTNSMTGDSAGNTGSTSRDERDKSSSEATAASNSAAGHAKQFLLRRKRMTFLAFQRLCKFCGLHGSHLGSSDLAMTLLAPPTPVSLEDRWDRLLSGADFAIARTGSASASPPVTVTGRVRSGGNAGSKPCCSFIQFLAFAEAEIDDHRLQAALNRFNLLPGQEEERVLVDSTLKSSLADVREHLPVAVMDAMWWRSWCEYTSISCTYDGSGTLVIGCSFRRSAHLPAMNLTFPNSFADSAGADKTKPVAVMRPDEIDTTSLQDPLDVLALRSDLVGGPNGDFVLLPLPCWFALQSLYGGGPLIKRFINKCRHVQAAPTPTGEPSQPPPPSQEAESEGDAQSSSRNEIASSLHVTVELHPVVLQGFWCNRFGRAEMLDGHIMCSPHSTVNQLLEKLLADLGLAENSVDSRNGQIEASVPPIPLLSPQDVRVWMLTYPMELGQDSDGVDNIRPKSTNKHETPKPESQFQFEHGRSSTPPKDAPNHLHGLLGSPRRVDSERSGNGSPASDMGIMARTAGSIVTISDVQPIERENTTESTYRERPLSIRFGLSSWWTLITSDKRSKRLCEIDLRNGSKIMLETKRSDELWPADRVVEPSGFREFHVGDKVDAQDKSGVWYPAQVVELSQLPMQQHIRASQIFNSVQAQLQEGAMKGSAPGAAIVATTSASLDSGGIKRVRVHFSSKQSKRDEVFDSFSNKIAPLGSYTVDPTSIPHLDIVKLLEFRRPSSALLRIQFRTASDVAIAQPHQIPGITSPKPKNYLGTPLIFIPSDERGAGTGDDMRVPHWARPEALADAVEEEREKRDREVSRQKSSGMLSIKNVKSQILGSNFRSGEGKRPSGSSNPRGSNRQAASKRSKSRRARGSISGSTRAGAVSTSVKKAWEEVNQQEEEEIGGVCGLVNLGNTCYFNSALQCLSHTPLFRLYFLSDRYIYDINKKNPLGTGGRLVQEFAKLLRELWEGEYAYLKPVGFKRMLDQVKPQFAGNEQQDAQEFLAEMLDSMHEDVNKVVDKPYTPQPADEVWDKMNVQEQGDNAWERHMARNQSVLVDLFQGQIRSEVSCPTCHNVSRTFDPFMFLSVPVPKQHEREILVTVVRRMFRWQSGDRAGEADVLDRHKTRRILRRYCFVMPRLGDVSDLKNEIHKKCGLEPQHSQVAEVRGGRVRRLLEDRDPLAILSQTNTTPAQPQGAGAEGTEAAADKDGVQCVAYEHTKDVVYIIGLSGDRMSYRSGMDEKRPKDKSNSKSSAKRGPSPKPEASLSASSSGAEAEAAVVSSSKVSMHYKDHAEYEVGADHTEGDLVVDINRPNEAFPQRIQDFHEGLRVDAIDHRGQWFTGSVVSVKLVDPSAQTIAYNSKSATDSSGRPGLGDNGQVIRGPTTDASYVRVHFDNFSPKWDEFYSAEDIERGALVPVYSSTRRKLKIIEMYILHRRPVSAGSQAPNPAVTEGLRAVVAAASALPPSPIARHPNMHGMEVFGLPDLLQVESYRSCEHTYRCIVEQAMRYMSPEEVAALAEEEKRRRDSCSPAADPPQLLDSSLLPFTINIFFQQRSGGSESQTAVQPGSNKPSADTDLGEAEEYGSHTEFPRDRERPICNLYNSRLVVTVDWKAKNRELPTEDDEAYTEAVQRQSVRKHGQNMLTLRDCLNAFTKEEELEEGAWYCSRCKAHQRGRMRSALYRLPDILVIHIKRFNMTARWREKIRSKVVFPLSSLDISEFMSDAKMDGAGASQTHERLSESGSPRGKRSPASAAHLYDLYAVANHIGGMSGGHYTAFVRCEGVQDDVSMQTENQKWMLFDDEYCEEVAPGRVVTESAYVLFYRRRRLTPSNIINMSL